VTRLGEFSPIWRLFSFDSFLKITERAQLRICGFFHRKKSLFFQEKNYFGYICLFPDFFLCAFYENYSLGTFFPQNLDKNWLGYILGYFFTNLSCHTESDSDFFPSKRKSLKGIDEA
jgi:hypothetical protein